LFAVLSRRTRQSLRGFTASWRQAYRGLLPQEYLDALSVEARTKTWAKAFSQLPGQTPTNLVAELDGQITAIGWFALGQQLAATQAVGAAIVLRCRYRIGPAEIRLLDLNRA
jgi:hypothetical protein